MNYNKRIQLTGYTSMYCSHVQGRILRNKRKRIYLLCTLSKIRIAIYDGKKQLLEVSKGICKWADIRFLGFRFHCKRRQVSTRSLEIETESDTWHISIKLHIQNRHKRINYLA